jgi:hypothetical protein
MLHSFCIIFFQILPVVVRVVSVIVGVNVVIDCGHRWGRHPGCGGDHGHGGGCSGSHHGSRGIVGGRGVDGL